MLHKWAQDWSPQKKACTDVCFPLSSNLRVLMVSLVLRERLVTLDPRETLVLLDLLDPLELLALRYV